MSSRDSGQWRHLSKLRRNLSECTTFSRPESTYWNNVTVMLFFHKRWWFQKKKFPNRRTVLASAWSDRCGITSRRFWSAVYWKKSDPIFLFSGENHSCQCPMSSFKEKRERYWSTVAPENEEHLGPENWVHYAQELRFFLSFLLFFFLKGLLSSAIKCS